MSTIREATARSKIVIFGTTSCPFCKRAKNLSRSYGGCEFINVDVYPGLREQLTDTTGQRTVPYVFYYGRFVGGYSEFQQMHSMGMLR